jgi:TPR repeat protein
MASRTSALAGEANNINHGEFFGESTRKNGNMRLLCLIGLAFSFLASPAIAGNFDEAKIAYYRGDYTTAFETFKKAADQGDAYAQSWLGDMYRLGKGASLDLTQAMLWYVKADARGELGAAIKIGGMFANGEGVPKDTQRATFWYEIAAKQRSQFAQHSVALEYLRGQDLPRDYQRAAYLLEKSARQGNVFSKSLLAGMHFRGDGVKQDYVEAYKWYTVSVNTLDSAMEHDKAQLILLQKAMTRQQIAEAQRRAVAFARTASTPTVFLRGQH